MTMRTKNVPFEYKSLDDDTGTFEATVAVFGNVDRGGDRIQPGAFRKTLARWGASGDPIPVIFNHEWSSPLAHIGVVEDAIETDQGLRIKARLDVTDNEVARQVHKLLKRRSLREFSFGYDIPSGGSKRAKDGATDLTEIDLFEVGPTLKGMNQGTELYAVKGALGVPREPDELRHATASLERDEQERRIPNVVVIPDPDPPVPDPAPEPEPLPEPEPVPVPAATLRKQAAETTRAHEEEQLPDVPSPAPEPADQPEPDVTAEIIDLRRELADVKRKQDAPEPATLRKHAERVRREREAEAIPNDVTPLMEAPGLDMAVELAALKASITELQDTLRELSKNADEPDPQDLRREAERVRRSHEAENLPDLPEQAEPDTTGPDGGPHKTPEALDAIVHPDDVEGQKAGHLKAVWSVAYINDLPDSAFLHIEPGGTKDDEGKTTPRSLRHFPYKDADGNIDLPHLRNALSRIPQSQSLPETVKENAAARARRILQAQTNKTVDETGQTLSVRTVDPLRQQAESQALEFASAGLSLRKPPRTVTPPPVDLIPLPELKRRTRDEMLRHLSEDTAAP